MSDNLVILSIDIGFKNPGFIIIDYQNNKINEINLFYNISYKKYRDCIKYLNYFISKKINLVIIEKQYSIKNISLLRFIEGYFLANNINVLIKNPISYIKKKNINRKDKKKFSINLINNFFNRHNVNINFKNKSDLADSLNIGLYYICKNILNKNNYNEFNINIESINLIKLDEID